MRFFPLHILIKDLSFFMIYFIIMKYNLTNETYLHETIQDFPSAPNMTFFDMIVASIYVNLMPLVFSMISYFPIVFILKKIIPKLIVPRLILTGFLLTCTTPLIYLWANGWQHNDYYFKKAEIIAWVLTFLISIIVYFLFNKKEKLKPKIIDSNPWL